ncbi:hypothetical protein Pst134EB_005930 [Puccinia striiformis f. sp. tritici]|nr:hypothetical protein Pst134EB_005930 [Puccinia striiformis f. sp. tritici]
MLMFHAELDCGEGSEKNPEQAPNEGQENKGQGELDQDPNLYASFLASRAPRFELDAIELVIRLNKQYPETAHSHRPSQCGGRVAVDSEGPNSRWASSNHREIPDGRAEYKCCPPIRTAANRDELWKGLESGIIDFVVSDHSPCTAELKEGSLMEAWGGIGGLGLGLSLLWTEGRSRALSNLEGRLLKWLCERPASFAGMGSLKGSLAPGYQCDLCIFDPDLAFQVTKEDLKFKNKISAYLGKKLSGRVVSTVLATELVYDIDHLSAPVARSERRGKLLLN